MPLTYIVYYESSQIKLVLLLVFITWEFLFSLFLLIPFDELHCCSVSSINILACFLLLCLLLKVGKVVLDSH